MADKKNLLIESLPDANETNKPISLEEACKKLTDALIPLFHEAFDPLIQAVWKTMDALAPQIESMTKEFARLWDAVLKSYPDNRVVWLALHHKKERIRKKNRKRILKWIERNEKQGG